MRVSPSILTCDFSRLCESATAAQAWGADELHLDVMDGVFVPNLTFGPHMVASLRPCCALPFDLHLMMQYPERLCDAFIDAGAQTVTVHLESSAPLPELLAHIRARGCGAGLAINPDTPWQALLPYLEQIDRALIMTVQPGFGGQSLHEDCLPKITALRREIARRGLAVTLEADGGVNGDNLAAVAETGLEVAVIGSALFSAEDPAGLIARVHGI